MGIADNLQGNRTQTFGYDNLNRISTAQSAATSGTDCWGQSFGYDAWANLLAENVTKCSGTQLSVGVNSQNQITNSSISYDASGDMLTDGVNTYTYDAENRISTVNGTAATYTYDAEGQRVLKQTGGSTNEYVYFNGQPIAERAANGDWSGYIYAGSRRLARADSYEDGIQIQGTNNVTGVANVFTYPDASVVNYTLQSGDKLYFRQYQAGVARGGIYIAFTDGSTPNWIALDQDGREIDNDGFVNTWHYRRVDLSAWAGKAIQSLDFLTESTTGVGYWAVIFGDVALVSSDGTVRAIYNGQSTPPTWT